MPEAGLLTELHWEDLEPGRSYGPYDYTPQPSDVALWARTYDRVLPDPPRVPPALVPIAVLKALREAFSGIPAGGVLARQTFRFGVEPAVGERMRTSVEVAEKYERRGRPFVRLAYTTTREDGVFVAESRQTLIWPRRATTDGGANA